jgi:hypothetical protein
MVPELNKSAADDYADFQSDRFRLEASKGESYTPELWVKKMPAIARISTSIPD